MERTKLYKIIIAALVIINVGMLVFFFMGRPNHQPPKAGELANKLGLEGSKRTIVTQLEKAHHVKKRKLMATDHRLHETLFSKIGTDDDVSLIQDQIEANFVEIEKMTYDFFHDVAKQCTAEQADQLKETIHRAFRQKGGGPEK